MASFNTETATEVTGLSSRQVRYWDKTGLVAPSVQRACGRGSRRLYSFLDLVELRVIGRLLKAGLSLQRIRRVVKYIHREYRHLQRPLANLRILTDGATVFVRSDERRQWENVLASGQVVWVVPFANLWNETEAAVHQLRGIKTGRVRIGRAEYDVEFDPDLEDGGWVASCPVLPGCLSQGDTLPEARKMIREAMVGWLAANETTAPAAKVKTWAR